MVQKKTSFESIYYSYFNLLFVFILSSLYLLRDTRLVYYTLQRGVLFFVSQVFLVFMVERYLFALCFHFLLSFSERS